MTLHGSLTDTHLIFLDNSVTMAPKRRVLNLLFKLPMFLLKIIFHIGSINTDALLIDSLQNRIVCMKDDDWLEFTA